MCYRKAQELAMIQKQTEFGDKSWDYFVLSATLGQVSLQVSRGTGVTPSGRSTALAKFFMNRLSTKLHMPTDGSLHLQFSMKELVLDDIRVYTQNQYKRVSSLLLALF
jgi:hypothetical protein